jgi:hypothetical protein
MKSKTCVIMCIKTPGTTSTQIFDNRDEHFFSQGVQHDEEIVLERSKTQPRLHSKNVQRLGLRFQEPKV